MIELGYDFKQAVSILEDWLHQYKIGNSKKTENIFLPNTSKTENNLLSKPAYTIQNQTSFTQHDNNFIKEHTKSAVVKK
jgi:hypothetical protein